MSIFWKGILIGAFLGLVGSLLSAYIKESIDKRLIKLSLKSNSKSIKKLEKEMERINSYKQDLNTLYLDMVKEIFFMVLSSMFFVAYVIIMLVYESPSISVFFGFLSMFMLFLIMTTYTKSTATINKVRKYDTYVLKTNKRIEYLKEQSAIKNSNIPRGI